MFMQDQEFSSLVEEPALLFFRGFLDNECPLVRRITSACSCQVTNNILDAGGQIPSHCRPVQQTRASFEDLRHR